MQEGSRELRVAPVRTRATKGTEYMRASLAMILSINEFFEPSVFFEQMFLLWYLGAP